MFTKCPECSTAFRVTAIVLQQAGGRVRCGGCGNAFSAIDHLIEDLADSNKQGAATPAGTSADDLAVDDKFAQTSKQLLATLDELAGPEDVRIEDTGIEWRVLDDVEEAGDAAAAKVAEVSQESLALEDARRSPPEQRRYDDNTPLPDDFDDEEEYEYKPPQRRASDNEGQDTAEFDQKQADLALSEPEDWTDLLDEVAEADDIPLEVEEELAAIHNELSVKEVQGKTEAAATEAAPADINSQFEMQAEAMGIDISGIHDVADEDIAATDDATRMDNIEEDDLTDAVPLLNEEEVAAGAASTEDASTELESTGEFDAQIAAAAKALLGEDDDKSAAEADATKADETTHDEELELSLEEDEADVAELSEEQMTVNEQLDEELAAAADSNKDFAATLAGMEDPSTLFDEDSADVETIIMEGEFIHASSETARLQAEKEAQARFKEARNLIDTYAANRGVRGGRRKTDPAGYGVITGTVLLALLLAGQVIHAYRETLSTYGLFNQTIGPVYRMLGNPVTPEWDIKGWRFEATNGSVAEEDGVLTIFSRIGNDSQLPLPYPLVHVSLTDRWEEIIGSRVLEPNEYLAGDLDPSKPVIPGQNFTAVITIEEPSVDATGFKLNVCYRVGPGRVRCATEDFKN